MSNVDILITWLNSAYAMEQSLAQVLENHAKDAEDFPLMRQRIEGYLDETRRHADRVKHCLGLLNETPSAAKSLLGNVTGMIQGASTGMFSDELVKNCLADDAAEHFENRVLPLAHCRRSSARSHRNRGNLPRDFAGGRRHGRLARAANPRGDHCIPAPADCKNLRRHEPFGNDGASLLPAADDRCPGRTSCESTPSQRETLARRALYCVA